MTVIPPKSSSGPLSATADPLARNVTAQLLHGAFGQAGQRLFAAPTFLPVFLFTLTGSELLVGVARGLQGFGTVLSPPLGAALIGHRAHIKWLGIAVGLASRAQILVIAAAVLWLAPASAVWVVLGALTLLGFFSGIQSVAFNALRARVIPRRRRGLVLGARNFAGGIAAALLAAWAGPALLGSAPELTAWEVLFAVAFVVSTAGLLGLALTRETGPVELAPRRGLRATFAAGTETLRSEPGFARFFTAYVLGSIGRMGIPFYVLHAAERLGTPDGVLPGALLGALTTIWLLTGTTTRLLWGTVGDRRGHRDVFLAGLALWILAQLLLMAADGVGSLFVFFTLRHRRLREGGKQPRGGVRPAERPAPAPRCAHQRGSCRGCPGARPRRRDRHGRRLHPDPRRLRDRSVDRAGAHHPDRSGAP